MLKKWTARPAVKYSLIAVAIAVWLNGLADQISDLILTAKYIGITLVVVILTVFM